MQEIIYRVGFYDVLRKGLQGHNVVEKLKYVGSFHTKPSYKLYDLGSNCGMTLNGSSSVLIEVYEVTEKDLENLDKLKVCFSKDLKKNTFNRETISSPYGEIIVYIYNIENIEVSNNTKNKQNLIHTSDYKDYYESKKVNQLLK